MCYEEKKEDHKDQNKILDSSLDSRMSIISLRRVVETEARRPLFSKLPSGTAIFL